MGQHSGRCTEPGYYPPQPRHIISIIDGITLGAAQWVEIHDPTMVEGDHNLEQEVCVRAGCMLVQMHVTNWTEPQGEDTVLSAVLDWLEAQNKTELKTLLGEHTSNKEGRLILQKQQNFTIHQKAL